jgi:predicted transglutaminase-like cysteine proteinase
MAIWNKILILILLTGCTPSIDQINRAVNRVPYVDRHFTSVDDFYRYGGKCEGYVFTKQHELEKAGYGRGNYQLVKYKGQMHIVLIYENYVLDNLTNKLMPLSYLQTFDEII